MNYTNHLMSYIQQKVLQYLFNNYKNNKIMDLVSNIFQFILLQLNKRTIIITHRPVVDEGWYDDFGTVFYGTDYNYSKINLPGE